MSVNFASRADVYFGPGRLAGFPRVCVSPDVPRHCLAALGYFSFQA